MRNAIIASVLALSSLFGSGGSALAVQSQDSQVDLECWVAVIVVIYDTETKEVRCEYDWEYVC